MNRALHRATPRNQRGAVAIIVGLSMVVLIGFAGLALDGGRLYINKTELQNGADACALSASYELTGAPTIPLANFTQASNAGILAATRNRVGFQAGAIAAGDVTVEFSASLTGGWLTAASTPPVNSRYVRCTIQQAGIAPWFMQVLGFGPATVRAAATATLANAQTNCGIPLAMCARGAAPTYGLVAGQWYDGRFGAGGGATGSFNWIDFTPPAGGASEVGDMLRGNGVCELNVTNPVGQGGVLGNAGAKAWNTRFGLYQSAGDNVNTAPPDRTGYAYTPTNWPSQANALANFLAKRAANANYGANVAAGNAVTGLSINNSYNPTTTTAQHLQFGADRRLAVAPVVNCNEWTSNQTIPIRAWACILMLHPIDGPGDMVRMEFEGMASDPTSPCSTSGVVGGGGSVGPLVPALVQ